MNAVAVLFSVAVLIALVFVVVRRAIVRDFRTARRAGMSSTSADRRRPSARLRLLCHVALGVFVLALAAYLAVAALAGRGGAYELRLAVAWTQVASLAAAGLCWVASRWAARREKHADRRWAARLTGEGITKPRGA